MKISIVMPSFNQARYVEAALQSILSQDYTDYEILFMDGGSTDGTMEIVEKYRDKLTLCVSRPDRGQSDALAQGFAAATGEVLTWLNTDDLLMPGALLKVASSFTRHPKSNWWLGNVIWISSDSRILKCWRGESPTYLSTKLGVFAAGGPSSFFRRNIYHEVGGVNLDLHYKMDTELWWKFIASGAQPRRLQGYTWALRLHENAKTSGAMFADKGDEKQRRIQLTAIEEDRGIETVRASYCWNVPACFSNFTRAVCRATSPAYVNGMIDSWRFRGKNVEVLSRTGGANTLVTRPGREPT